MTPATCTVDNVSGIVADIKAEIGVALAKSKSLYGQPKEVILASVDADVLVSLSVLAGLVCDLVCVSICYCHDCISLTPAFRRSSVVLLLSLG